MENLGDYGWWGNWGIFVSLRSLVKYGENMEGMGNVEKNGEVCWELGKVSGMWEEVGGGVEEFMG